jgi:hypothetical protein
VPTRIGSTAARNSGGAVSSHTVSIDVAAGTNRCLVVTLSFWSSGVTPSTRSVTWNGQAMTRVDLYSRITSNFNAVEIWYLLEASLSTATADVVITCNAVTQTLYWGAQLFGDVDQVTPFGAMTGAFSAAGAGNITPTVTAASTIDGETIDVLGTYAATAYTNTPTDTASWTVHRSADDISAGASSKTAVGATTTVDWTMSSASGSPQWWIAAATLNAPSAATDNATSLKTLGPGTYQRPMAGLF